MRAYEIVYILDAALDQATVDAKLEAFHKALGGEITTVDHWGVRQLAYPIRKAGTGYYVIVQVTADPTALPEYERLLRLDEEVMRYLLVLNEGQPTSGASVLAQRPVATRADAEEDDDGGDRKPEDEGGDRKPEDGDRKPEDDGGDEEPDDDGAREAEEGGDEDPAGAAQEEAADEPVMSGPPIFSGARGRRRRHEGPRIVLLNYKDVTTLSRFLTEQGKILPKRTTKVTARFQRQLGTAVKRARHLALLPYIRDHEG